MRKNLMSLSPLAIFLLFYLGTGIVIGDFSKVPITVAFLFASVYAILITKGSIAKRIDIFSKGAGNSNILLMVWIFLLAGAFAQSAKDMGAIDATVNLTLSVMPEYLLLPGIFLAACFISLSIGTSVGTIAALTPVAVGIANSTNIETAFIVAIVVGGSFFGDNLSFISDTTIVATQTQKCKMNDKFKVNIHIIAPMVILVLIAYFIMSREINAQTDIPEANLLKITPYIVVIITAVSGINVLIVLSIGLLLTGCIGIIDGSYDVCSWFVSLGNGMVNMTELIIMTLLASGMLALVRHNGGISFIISTFIRNINSKRNAEFCIAALTCLINICTANNTVAIITTGPIAADISERFGIDRRKSASILDTVSCFTQGLLPYGAQILIAAGLANIAPVTIIPHLYYPMAIGLGIVLSIIFRYPKKYS